MIHRTRRTTTRNPNVIVDLIESKILPVGKGDKYKVNFIVAGIPLMETIPIKDRNTAKKIARIGEEVIENRITSHKNPKTKYQLLDEYRSIYAKNMGLPQDPKEAFRLGYLEGMRSALTEYGGLLGLLKTRERRAIIHAMNEAITNAVKNLQDVVAIRGAGFDVPIPIVKMSAGK